MKKLNEQLKAADRSRRILQGMSSVVISLKYYLMAFVVLMTVDVIFHLSSGKRLAGVIIYGLGLALFFFYIFWRSFVKSANLRSIARQLESKENALGSTLINTLELEVKIENGEFHGRSKELAEQAVDSYVGKCDSAKFCEILNPRKFGRDFKRALLALSIIVLCLIPVRNIVSLELLRYFEPYADHPAFSLTKLVVTIPSDDNFKVIYGEKLMVKAQAHGHIPQELFITFYEQGKPQTSETLPMYNKGKQGFVQQLENVRVELEFYVHNKDKTAMSKKRRVALILTPKVEKAWVEITPPAYTGLKKRKKEYKWNNLSLLKGSKIEFFLSSNRPLQSGGIKQNAESGEKIIALKSISENEVAGAFVVGGNSRLRFTVKDISGLDSIELHKGSVTATFDRPPTVSIVTPERDSFVTEDFLLQVKIQANDDYGIEQIRLHRALNGMYSDPLILKAQTANLESLSHTVEIPIRELGVVPGDTMTFYADTLDNSPQGQIAICPRVNLRVVSVQEYNEYLRRRSSIDDIVGKYDEILERMQASADEQRKLNKEIAKVKESLAKSLSTEQKKALREKLAKAKGELAEAKTAADKKAAEEKIASIKEELKEGGKGLSAKKAQEKMAELIRKQNQINSNLEELVDDMNNFGRENPLYDVEAALAAEMKKMANKLEESLDGNNEELQEFSEKSESSDKQQQMDALEALSEAGQRQLSTLERQQEEYSERVLETLFDMSLMNALLADFNRFKAIYQLQKKIAEDAQRFNIERELSRADELSLKKLARNEKTVADELEKLIKRLEADAEDAEMQFPKASESARKLAEKIKDSRLIPLAEQALNSMLIPDGPQAYQLAERLHREMQEFFNDPTLVPTEGNPYAQNEFDQYLKLMLGMPPGDTFGQMSQGLASGMGRGKGRARGQGSGGSAGNSQGGSGFNQGPQIGLLGNEQLGRSDKESDGSGQSKGRRAQSGNSQGKNSLVSVGNAQNSKSKNSRKVKAETLSSETLINEYDSLIDAYFEKLTEEEE
ncbi:MAG: hypothetical protein HRT88_02590 [Lentisphaeraceae bacterium]|nr:hypothetical protein [Lentisphaeraceae bacterium]